MSKAIIEIVLNSHIKYYIRRRIGGKYSGGQGVVEKADYSINDRYNQKGYGGLRRVRVRMPCPRRNSAVPVVASMLKPRS